MSKKKLITIDEAFSDGKADEAVAAHFEDAAFWANEGQHHERERRAAAPRSPACFPLAY